MSEESIRRRTLEDWMKCINCKVRTRNGEIRHLRTCPEHVSPRVNATSVRLGDILTRKRR